MTLLDYAKILCKRWITVVAVTVLGILAGAGVGFLLPKTYEAQSTSLVSVTGGTTSTDGSSIYQGSQFSVQRVQSYTDLVGSPQVLGPVISLLHLRTTVVDLRKKVSATSPQATALLEVRARDADAHQAAAIANAVAGQMRAIIELLETPAGAGHSPVNVTAIKPADPPTSPASPRLPLDLVLGLLGGLAVGIIAAVLRDQVDTRVSTVDELTELTGTRLLGSVESGRSGAVPGPRDPQPEAYASVRTNLRFVNVDAPPRCIAVTSAVAGEGRTTVACNLAVSLARAGSRVCLVEADLRRPRVAGYLGVGSAHGLTDVLTGDRQLDDVLVSWGNGALSVLAGGAAVADPSNALGSAAMANLLAQVRQRFDYVVIDVPPLVPVTDGAVVARIADGTVLVTRHRFARRAQLRHAVESLAAAGATLLGVVLTFAPGRERGYGSVPEAPATSAAPVRPAQSRPASKPPVTVPAAVEQETAQLATLEERDRS